MEWAWALWFFAGFAVGTLVTAHAAFRTYDRYRGRLIETLLEADAEKKLAAHMDAWRKIYKPDKEEA